MTSQGSAGTVVAVPPRRPARSRILDIYFDRSNPPNILVLDKRRWARLYIVSISLDGKPDMRMKRYSNRPLAGYRPIGILPSQWREQKLLVGDVLFDKSSGTIDLEFDSFTRSLQSIGCLTRSFKFESSKGPLTWQHEGVFGKGLQLLDTEKRRVTTFSNAELVPGRITKVQIIGGEDMTRAWLEEVLISSLAVLEWKRRIGFIGGLSMIDAKRMTRRVAAAVAALPETTRQILEGKNQRKTEGETGRELKVVTGYDTGRLTGEE